MAVKTAINKRLTDLERRAGLHEPDQTFYVWYDDAGELRNDEPPEEVRSHIDWIHVRVSDGKH